MLRRLRNYRPNILFLIGVGATAALSIYLEGGISMADREFVFGSATAMPQGYEIAEPQPLSADEMAAAETAWAYFERNTQPETGLVNSTANFPSTTLWDQGGYILALVSAHELELIEAEEFRNRAMSLLESLSALELLDVGLPNKVYDTRSLAMVNYQNVPVPDGIGWSALDICRMLVALRALETNAPEFGQPIRALIGSWSLDRVAVAGELIGGARNDDGFEPLQEGRLGYEQYAARAAALWGLDASMAMIAGRNLIWGEASGVDVPTDRRLHTSYGAITPILSEPWLLEAFELGLNAESAALASTVFEAQIARIAETGEVVFVTEDHINQEPYFLYSSVHANGRPWAVLDETGGRWPQLRTLSTKASFGWEALYRQPETAEALRLLTPLAHPEFGWPAGIFEADGTPNDVYTLNTNAVILEALHFGAYGPLLRAERD